MKYLKYFIILFIVAVMVSWGARYMIKSNTPPFLLSKLEELQNNPILMDSIGGFNRFEYSYNKQDFKFKDTVRYSIKIDGNTKVLIYNGVQLRTSSESWKLVDENLNIK